MPIPSWLFVTTLLSFSACCSCRASTTELRSIDPKLTYGEIRQLQLPKIVTFEPHSPVLDQLAIGLDQRSIATVLSNSNVSQSDLDKAYLVYSLGGHSQAVAHLSITPSLLSDVKEGALVTKGLTANDVTIQGHVDVDYSQGANQINVTYDVSANSSERCYVGGLNETNSDGCFNETGEITIGSSVYSYTYNVTKNNTNLRTIQSFSTAANSTMLKGKCYGCPYKDFAMYYDYYKDPDYADTWVQSALQKRSTSVFAQGNNNFTVIGPKGCAEAAKKGTVLLNVFMQVLKELENAIDDCDQREDFDSYTYSGSWDNGVAFYTGSLEETEGSDKGYLMYNISDQLCMEFKTCGINGDSTSGFSKVNLNILSRFELGATNLRFGSCEAARSGKNRISELMTVPLIQGTLRHAYAIEKLQGGEAEKGAGAAYAAALLPKLYYCNATDAATVFDYMHVNASTTSFSGVKFALESNYACLNITCADVGGLYNIERDNYYSGAFPCEDNYVPGSVVQNDIVDLAGYTPRSPMTSQAFIDLDQESIMTQVNFKAQKSFDAAKTIYQSGGHSKPFASLTLNTTLQSAVTTDMVVTGVNEAGKTIFGTAVQNYTKGAQSFAILYNANQAQNLPCQVGALVGVGESNFTGCFAQNSTITIDNTSYGYTYSNTEDNKNEITIADFSTSAESQMYDKCPGCPFNDFKMYYGYYGKFDYANQWVLAALEGSETAFTAGNADFSFLTILGRAKAVEMGTVVMNIFMMVLGRLEQALNFCENNGKSNVEQSLTAWDEAVAFYTGSLVGPDGLNNGNLLYGLANKFCVTFKTCGPLANSLEGESKVNIDVFRAFISGQENLILGDCNTARRNKERISQLMAIPLIQGVIFHAFHMRPDSNETMRAEGATYAAAVLPKLAFCDTNQATIVESIMGMNSISTGFFKVKKAFEANFDCLKLSCSEVGRMYDVEAGDFLYEATSCLMIDARPGISTSLAGYEPEGSVASKALIDVDLLSIVHQLSFGTPQSFLNATLIYQFGGHSMSFASIKLDFGLFDVIAKGTRVKGFGKNKSTFYGTTLQDYDVDETNIRVLYSTGKEGDAPCQVGALLKAGETGAVEGCFLPASSLTIEGYSYPYSTYRVYDDTENALSIANLSTTAKTTMLEGCDGCPYVDFAIYHGYYTEIDYANQWILAALARVETSFSRGNADFNLMNLAGRQEVVAIGTVCLNIFMYVLQELEDALDKCESANLDMMDVPVLAWDSAVAFYTGSLENKDNPGEGLLLHTIADKLCVHFKTCGSNGNSLSGKSKVNHDIFQHFESGRKDLHNKNCPAARENKEQISRLMTIPLVQGVLLAAYSIHYLEGGEVEKARGAAYLAAVLPKVHVCDEDDAQAVYENMRVGATFTSFTAVKAVLESNYACMEIKGADVGGVYNIDAAGYYVGAAPYTADGSGSEEKNVAALVLGPIFGCLLIVGVVYVLFFRGNGKRKSSDMLPEVLAAPTPGANGSIT